MSGSTTEREMWGNARRISRHEGNGMRTKLFLAFSVGGIKTSYGVVPSSDVAIIRRPNCSSKFTINPRWRQRSRPISMLTDCSMLRSSSFIRPFAARNAVRRKVFAPQYEHFPLDDPSHTQPCTPSLPTVPVRTMTPIAALGTLELLVIGAGVSSLALSASLGANDVANSLGTAVGTGAVSIPLALTIGAVMELAGAVLCGATVTHTISSSVISATAAAVAPPMAYILGMLAVTVGCTAWLACATKFGMPVSSTHAVVGALAGLGVVSGWGVNTSAVTRILSSWLISPILGGFLAVSLHRIIRSVVMSSRHPLKAARNVVPLLAASAAFVLTLSVVSGGRFSVLTPAATVALCSGISVIVAVLTRTIARRGVIETDGITNVQSELSEKEAAQGMFKGLQVATACMLAFSHGSNDVSNAVGPFAAVWATYKGANLFGAATTVPLWMLLSGGLGLSLGLAIFGRPVMKTVGTKITKLQPSMGFCVEFSTALTVLLASRLGLPVSTTHTLVGCIVALGLSDGDVSRVDRKVVASIAASWGVTLPFSALVTVAFYSAVRPLLPVVATVL